MPHSAQPISVSSLDVTKSFLGISIALLFLLFVVASAHYYSEYRAERLTKKASETLNVKIARRMIITDIAAVVPDLLILAEHVADVVQETDWAEQRYGLAHTFSEFSSKKGIYDQVRYLDEQGNEVIRVNYVAGQGRLVPAHALQNKAHRYYFQNAVRLKPGEVYVSPLDLNIEGGLIEEPYKPVMRFATPVIDASGKHKGVVVLNYLGKRLIQHFKHAAANIADHVQLLNNDGYWLSSTDPTREWGFMFGNDQRFGNLYPEAWDRMQHAGSGQLLISGGLFSFSSIKPTTVAERATDPTLDLTTLPSEVDQNHYHWKIVSRLPLEVLAPLPGRFIKQNAALYGSMLLLLLLIAWMLAYYQTRHRWAEEQTQYESRFRRTLEDIQLAAVSVDEKGRIGFCNDYFCKLTGWARNEVIGKNWVDTFVPDSQKVSILEMLATIETPNRFPARYEGEIQDRNGERHLVAWNNTLSFNNSEGLMGVTAIGEDITEKRRNEEQVRKLSVALEQSPSIVMITNRRGLIEYVNPKFTEVTGYQPQEVMGKNPKILKSGETSTDEYQDMWKMIANGEVWHGEFHNRRKNGELYWESASITALRDSSGEITHFLALKEDITERKRLEKTIEKHNQEIARTQALTAMGRMSSMIAHDLRNPLSSVKMGLQILSKKRRPGDEESAELCQIGLDQVRYMENILSDMLTFSRPEAMNIEWVSIDKLLTTTIGMVRKQLDESGTAVQFECAEGLPAFPGDANKLKQLFSNLVMNAAQAMDDPPAGERKLEIDIRLHLDTKGTFIRVSICDNGHGLGDHTGEQLFEPFFTTRSKGTGLGLAIVRQIADQHHAPIELRAREQGGSCAIIMLPTIPVEGMDSVGWENGTQAS